MNELPIIDIDDSDTTPTEKKIPTEKDIFQLTIEPLYEIAEISSATFNEGIDATAKHDKELSELCRKANEACLAVVNHLINKVTG